MKEAAKAIIHKDGEYLLQLRSNIPSIVYPNCWSFFGGEIEEGETPWQALQRELEEELEWIPEHGSFLYDCVNPDVPCRDHFFAVNFNGNRQHLVLHEGQALGWFTFAELKHLDRGFQVEQHLIRAGICGALNASIFNAGL